MTRVHLPPDRCRHTFGDADKRTHASPTLVQRALALGLLSVLLLGLVPSASADFHQCVDAPQGATRACILETTTARGACGDPSAYEAERTAVEAHAPVSAFYAGGDSSCYNAGPTSGGHNQIILRADSAAGTILVQWTTIHHNDPEGTSFRHCFILIGAPIASLAPDCPTGLRPLDPNWGRLLT